MPADFRDRLQASLGNAYTLGRELTGGAMARVFVAEERALRRQVVIKVLPPDVSAELSIERFRREVQIAAGLQHPLLVPVLSAGESAGLVFYSMPFIEGESLRSRLERERQLPIDEAIRLMQDVAEALAYAHDHGVVHRDIKPENILLSGGHALLTDFGIAKALEVAKGETLTATGISVGTPAYLAPEQATGERDLDGRADLYALGCVLYEALTGQVPYHGPTTQSVIAQHLGAAVPSVRVLRATVSPELDGLVRRAMAKSKVDRFATAAEFRDVEVEPPGINARGGLSERCIRSHQARAMGCRGPPQGLTANSAGRPRSYQPSDRKEAARVTMGLMSAIATTAGALLALESCHQGARRERAASTDSKSDTALIADALSAAPPAISRQASVVAFDEQGRERTLRPGSGEFTCFPDDPATPGDDPMCFDRSGLAWARAWMAKRDPPPGPVGLAYMLRGSWAASNADPHATAPRPGERWVETGPALMVLNVRGQLADYPRQPSDPARPFVMWPGTPYEHLMVPVGPAPR